jgi:hypothetical protein
MTATELKALAYSKLLSRGTTVHMNHVVTLSNSVRGYQRVTLDIAVLKEGKPILAAYVGPRKQRKITKYKLTKVPFLELAQEEDLARFIELFIRKLSEIIY